jgi:hypothetical protein
MINQTKESRIFFNLSLLPLSFLQVSLKPNIVLKLDRKHVESRKNMAVYLTVIVLPML